MMMENNQDLISRRAAIDALMKRDKALRNINWYDKPYAEGECKGIDEALDIISALPPAHPDLTESDWRLIKQMRSNYNGTYAKVIDKLIASAQPEPKWISCSERLPEDKTAYYLATVANRGLFFTTTVNNDVDCVRWDYDRRKGQDSWHWCTTRTVIAWMPLPEPWEE